jgi:hypothetical protein
MDATFIKASVTLGAVGAWASLSPPCKELQCDLIATVEFHESRYVLMLIRANLSHFGSFEDRRMDNVRLQEQLEDIDTLLHDLVEVTNALQDLSSLPIERVMSVNADIASLKVMRASLARQIYNHH